MRFFQKLRTLRGFQNEHLELFGTVADRHLIFEIGYHQAKRKPLTLKQVFHLDVGSIATVQRRLRRLKKLGFVQQKRSAVDRRAVELTLSAKCLRILAKYDALIGSKPPAPERGEPRHICGLCDRDAAIRDLIAAYLVQGLKRGDKCVLVAPAGLQHEILANLPPRRRASEPLVVSEGHESPEAMFAFFKHVLGEAKQAGQAMCVAANMSWTQSKNVPIDAMLAIEKRLDSLAARLPLTGLCVYDTRHFSGSDFLHAVKCHRDHAHYPIALG